MPPDPYLYRRAEQELRMAERATCAEAVKVHYQLANFYLDQFYSPAAGADTGTSQLPVMPM